MDAAILKLIDKIILMYKEIVKLRKENAELKERLAAYECLDQRRNHAIQNNT